MIPGSLEVRWEHPLTRNFGQALAVTGRYVNGKIFVDYRREERKKLTGLPGKDAFWEWKIGVSDLNGVLYWLIR